MFPPNKNSPEVVARLKAYKEFLDSLPSHKNIIFADEKPLKEVDCYGKVRRDPMTGVVNANHCVNANSRNRWNIFAAINVKKNVEDNCYALVLEEKGDSDCFQEYVEMLISNGFLESGDIFIVDNCTIHTAGENEHLQEVLWQDLRILMLTLPPYHPELNPIELVFNDLVQVLTRENARDQHTNISFHERVVRFFLRVKRRHVIEKYRAQGYRV
jgi:transposase